MLPFGEARCTVRSGPRLGFFASELAQHVKHDAGARMALPCAPCRLLSMPASTRKWQTGRVCPLCVSQWSDDSNVFEASTIAIEP